jgi:hypothetical protein
MEAWKLLAAAPYCPHTVEALKRAFDEAWASIASTTSPDLVENTRLRLAHAIVAHAALGRIDPEGLKSPALDAIQKHPPHQSQASPAYPTKMRQAEALLAREMHASRGSH